MTFCCALLNLLSLADKGLGNESSMIRIPQCSNLDGHLTTIHILTSKSDFDYMTMSIKCRLQSFFDMFLIKSLLKSIKLTLESIEINLKSNKSM